MDNGYYTVKFDSLLLKEAVVEGDSILPPLRTEATESSDSDSGDASDSSYARGMAEISTQKPGWSGNRPRQAPSCQDNCRTSDVVRSLAQ